MKPLYRFSALLLIPAMLVSCATGPPELSTDSVRIYDTARGKFVELPKGLKIDAALNEELSSTASREGQRFSIHTTEPVLVGDKVVIPNGTRIDGTIKKIKPPKMKILKAKIIMEFDKMYVHGRAYDIKGETHKSKADLAEKGGKAGGEYAAKETAKYFIPILGWVFLAMSAKKGYDYYQAEKEITLPKGTPLIVKLGTPVSVPYN